MLLSHQNHTLSLKKTCLTTSVGVLRKALKHFPAEFYCFSDIPSDTLSTTLVDPVLYFIIIKGTMSTKIYMYLDFSQFLKVQVYLPLSSHHCKIL